MKTEDFREKITQVATSTKISAQFYFVVKKEGVDAEIFHADIEAIAQSELCTMFSEALITKIVLNEDLSVVKFSKADNRANSIYEYDLAEIPSGFKLFSSVLANNKINKYDFTTNNFNEVSGMIIRIGDDKSEILIYKHFYSVSLLKKNGRYVSLGNFGNKNRLEKLDTDLIKINSNFDLLVIENDFFIYSIDVAEKFFGLDLVIQNTAKIGIDAIMDSGLVVDVSLLQSRISTTSFARKLIRVSKGSPVLNIVRNSDIIKFAKNHPFLSGKIKFNKEETQIDLKTKVSQDYFLKLLNDDYLHSQLTNFDYESLAKDSLNDSE